MTGQQQEEIGDIIQARFTDTPFSLVGVIAGNIARGHGPEWSLTYLLGAMDALSALREADAVKRIREVREEVKKIVRPPEYYGAKSA